MRSAPRKRKRVGEADRLLHCSSEIDAGHAACLWALPQVYFMKKPLSLHPFVRLVDVPYFSTWGIAAPRKDRRNLDSSKFDDLTKILATSTSRRQALRRMGGILGGTALAGLFPGLAFASNSACAQFCASVFGAKTKAAGQCTSDAAHGKGLCYTCGPASSGGTKAICCPENPNGTCTSYSSSTCCPTGQICQNGTCVTMNTFSWTCSCNDGSTQTPCLTTSCPDLSTIQAVCGQVCANNMGSNGGGGCSPGC